MSSSPGGEQGLNVCQVSKLDQMLFAKSAQLVFESSIREACKKLVVEIQPYLKIPGIGLIGEIEYDREVTDFFGWFLDKWQSSEVVSCPSSVDFTVSVTSETPTDALTPYIQVGGWKNFSPERQDELDTFGLDYFIGEYPSHVIRQFQSLGEDSRTVLRADVYFESLYLKMLSVEACKRLCAGQLRPEYNLYSRGGQPGAMQLLGVCGLDGWKRLL